jgi:hypothetical protein
MRPDLAVARREKHALRVRVIGQRDGTYKYVVVDILLKRPDTAALSRQGMRGK